MNLFLSSLLYIRHSQESHALGQLLLSSFVKYVNLGDNTTVQSISEPSEWAVVLWAATSFSIEVTWDQWGLVSQWKSFFRKHPLSRLEEIKKMSPILHVDGAADCLVTLMCNEPFLPLQHEDCQPFPRALHYRKLQSPAPAPGAARPWLQRRVAELPGVSAASRASSHLCALLSLSNTNRKTLIP